MIKGLTQEQAKATGIIIVVLAVVIIAAIIIKKLFGGLDALGQGAADLLQKIGIGDSQEVIDAKNKINGALSGGSTSYWSPEFYQNAPGGARILPVDTAHDLCDKIYNAYGFFSYLDTPEDALAAFKMCAAKSAVSFLVVEFNVKYNADLLTWLTKKSDTDRDKTILGQIISYCDSLPAY